MEEKPAGFTPIVRRIFNDSYVSNLMSHINDEADHMLVITHQGRIRVEVQLWIEVQLEVLQHTSIKNNILIINKNK